AIATGMRRSELLSLQWRDVDLANGHILLPTSKNGDSRVIRLNSIAVAVLESLNPAQGHLFNVTRNQTTVAFKRACRAAGIQDFHFHDLRHTAASWMCMTKADIHTVATLLGHRSLAMAARYQHLSGDFLSKAVEGLDAVFGPVCHHYVTAQPEQNLLEGEAPVIH